MKNKIFIIFCVFILSLFLFSCSTQLRLQTRTNWVVTKSHINADTIYSYSIAFSDFNLVWYNKGNFIHSFLITPKKIKKYKPVEAKNIIVEKDSISKYFDIAFGKDVQCFEQTLDGEWIVLHIKRQENMSSSIDTECLFHTKFEPNSFPYKLQHDFSKIYRPIDFDFEKMYWQDD